MLSTCYTFMILNWIIRDKTNYSQIISEAKTHIGNYCKICPVCAVNMHCGSEYDDISYTYILVRAYTENEITAFTGAFVDAIDSKTKVLVDRGIRSGADIFNTLQWVHIASNGEITMTKKNQKTEIAIMRWESGKVPQGLIQLEALPGNSTNPKTYPFPVKFIEIPGACVKTVITHPDEEILNRMISIGKELENEGIKAIATSCGFNAIFQQKVASAINIPFFSSSLLLVPMLQAAVGIDNGIIVITANKSSLSESHLSQCGITKNMNINIIGLENEAEWNKIFNAPDKNFDMKKVEDEIINVAVQAITNHDNIKAIVLECTDLPPFAKKISEATGCMVFDFTTMICLAASSLGKINMY